jgi:hypothetical protein
VHGSGNNLVLQVCAQFACEIGTLDTRPPSQIYGVGQMRVERYALRWILDARSDLGSLLSVGKAVSTRARVLQDNSRLRDVGDAGWSSK